MGNSKKIVYVDMDGVLADFDAYIHRINPSVKELAKVDYEAASKIVDKIMKDSIYFGDYIGGTIFTGDTLFARLQPIPFAVNSFEILSINYDTYILSTPVQEIPLSYLDKKNWVDRILGDCAKKKLILTHNKGLMKGDYIIDDRRKNGVDMFEGEHIWFGQGDTTNWMEVLSYLSRKDGWSIVESMQILNERKLQDAEV